MRLCLPLALSLALIDLAAAPAQASLLNWTFEGSVTESPAFNPLADELPVGTSVAFTVMFDTDAPDQCDAPDAGFYAGPSGYALVNGITYSSEWTAMEVNNPAANCVEGGYGGATLRFLEFDGPFSTASLTWVIGPGDSQPTVAPLSALLQFGYACVMCADVAGVITSSEVAPVATPEPATLALVLAGLGVAGVRRRRRPRSPAPDTGASALRPF